MGNRQKSVPKQAGTLLSLPYPRRTVLAYDGLRAAANVATIVLNWNGWRDTVDCLESLLECSPAPRHVIVCDNGSTDGSLARLREWATSRALPFEELSGSMLDAAHDGLPWLIFLRNGHNGGYAAGNNVGIKFALDRLHADFVWLLNNDCVVEPNAMARMLKTAKANPRSAMIGSALMRYDAPETVQALGGGYIMPVICHDTQLWSGRNIKSAAKAPIELDHLLGASLLVRADAIRQVGLMDESYFLYREETDWCIRMRQRGWKLQCRTDALVWHKQARSVGFKSAIHDYYAVRNVLHLVRKFYPLALPTTLAYFACRSLLPKVVRGQFARAGAVCRALAHFALGVTGRWSMHTDSALLEHYGDGASADHRPAQRTRLVKVLERVAVVLPIVVALVVSAADARVQSKRAPLFHMWTQASVVRTVMLQNTTPVERVRGRDPRT